MRPAPHPLEADLSAYLDGELPVERRQMVEAWLAESDEARRRLAELRAVSDRLAALPRLQAPDAITAALARAAEQRQLFGEDAPARRLGIYRATVRILSAAAVLLVAVGIGYNALRPGTIAPPGPSQSPPLSRDAVPVHPEALVRSTPTPEAGTAGAADMPMLAERPATLSATDFDANEAAEVRAPDRVAVLDAVKLPSWHSLTREAGAAGVNRTVIDVTITPTTAVEYAATVAVLQDWENRGLSAGAEAGEPVSRQIAPTGGTAATAVEHVYEVEVGDLSYRLNQLALNAPQQVFVQMSFVAAPDDILSRVGSPPSDASRHVLYSIAADHPTGTAAGSADGMGAPRPAGPPAAAAAPRGETPPPAAEPAPAAPAPSGPPAALEAARDTDRATDAASQPAGALGAIMSPSVANLETRSTQRLLNLVLRGQQPAGADAVQLQNRGQFPSNRGNVASQNVLFRVRLLPPLGDESATAAVGPPAELANTATRPAAEAARPDTEPSPPAESR